MWVCLETFLNPGWLLQEGSETVKIHMCFNDEPGTQPGQYEIKESTLGPHCKSFPAQAKVNFAAHYDLTYGTSTETGWAFPPAAADTLLARRLLDEGGTAMTGYYFTRAGAGGGPSPKLKGSKTTTAESTTESTTTEVKVQGWGRWSKIGLGNSKQCLAVDKIF